jgi:hypothetical protein
MLLGELGCGGAERLAEDAAVDASCRASRDACSWGSREVVLSLGTHGLVLLGLVASILHRHWRSRDRRLRMSVLSRASAPDALVHHVISVSLVGCELRERHLHMRELQQDGILSATECILRTLKCAERLCMGSQLAPDLVGITVAI